MISNESPKTDRQIITALASAADLPPFDFLQRTRVLRMRIFSTELLVKPWPWHAPPCGHTICGTATIRCLSLNMFGRWLARFCCIHWQPLASTVHCLSRIGYPSWPGFCFSGRLFLWLAAVSLLFLFSLPNKWLSYNLNWCWTNGRACCTSRRRLHFLFGPQKSPARVYHQLHIV